MVLWSLQGYSVRACNSDRKKSNHDTYTSSMLDMKSHIPVFKLGPVHTELHMSPLI